MISLTTDRTAIDIDVVHRYLSEESYWAKNIPRSVVERAIDGSRCFGAFDDGRQVGFARVISDGATYAYICDVFVLPSHRGQGISKALMAAIRNHPDLQSLRRWSLLTRDAHNLYSQFGFHAILMPERYMEIRNDPYGSMGTTEASPRS